MGKKDTEKNRYRFFKALIYSIVIETAAMLALVTVALILGWHQVRCGDKVVENKYLAKLLCTPWYRPIEFSIEGICFFMKIYFILIARQHYLNSAEGVSQNIRRDSINEQNLLSAQ